MGRMGGMTEFFLSSVGRPDSESGAAQEFRAEQQLCSTKKAKIFVRHPRDRLAAKLLCREVLAAKFLLHFAFAAGTLCGVVFVSAVL
jgi:hypothetical protein